MRQIVIVGGGTAGWLSACMIAARLADRESVQVTLIEAPDIAPLGVGEGTWPTMRRTLSRIGIAETDFLRECDGSFKQGSRFDGWVSGEAGDSYLHPFTAPPEAAAHDVLAAWRLAPDRPFAHAMTPQARICELGYAPRQKAMPDYAGALNYAYHLDAGKLAVLLRDRACGGLGVRHVADRVTDVVRGENGDIEALHTQASGPVSGDLFIDCTGRAATLIGDTLGVAWRSRTDVLFNDSALAVQVPVAADSAIASQTNATAHRAGWLWDIGLPSRRGVGCVFSSAHMGDGDAMAVLSAYVARAIPGAPFDEGKVRKLAFTSGHRARFWQNNCLAIGQSAGFMEPLEASAIVMIELSLDMLLDNFPANRDSMDVHADRFNRLFRYRWDRVVDFLKLHYVLSRREEPYWRDHRDDASIPDTLAGLLSLWRHQPPSVYDFPHRDEIFPAASHQYVLYGMGGLPDHLGTADPGMDPIVREQMNQVQQRSRALASALPSNRAYLDALRPVTRGVAGA
ncbi:tryptophan halogenase family protein [uncultured Croceicoccus sp.]|uniref:tryptophan halogenase family protein n=1 Tax=uncultured Croceicoccus sp. TaxID=1295329 RepID=UPI00262FDBA5|nr:tryptophan halogenase family protein [uncultured Croceicoccus sp.]